MFIEEEGRCSRSLVIQRPGVRLDGVDKNTKGASINLDTVVKHFDKKKNSNGTKRSV